MIHKPRTIALLWSVVWGTLALAVTWQHPALAQETENGTATKCGPVEITGTPLRDRSCTRLAAYVADLDKTPKNKIFAARQRARQQADDLQALLVSEGYYAASVGFTLETAAPFAVHFSAEPGPRFKITAYELEWDLSENGEDGESETAQKESRHPADLAAMGLPPRATPTGETIVEMEEAITGYLQQRGWPEAEITARQILANYESATATVDLTIAPGPYCTYGDWTPEGQVRLKPDFIKALVTFPRGKPCSAAEMEEMRTKLTRTGLFVAADIKPDYAAATNRDDSKSERPMIVRVREAKARSIGAGVSYASNRGAGGHVFWEHRNLLGRAENLRAEILIEEIKQEGALTFRKPVPSRNATLFASTSIQTEARDAYDATRYTFSVGAEYPLWGPWRFHQSIDYEYADVEDAGVRETGHSVLVPLTLSQTTVENPLNTEDGLILDLTVAPAYSTFGDGSAFIKLDGRIAHHLSLDKKDRWDVSTWAHVGSLQGAATADISPTQLYYGGGSKSVRAIAWEHLGPLDSDATPLGGRSTLEGGVELRHRIFGNWQVVGFVEGGQTFAARAPDFSEDFLWGGGLGLRYLTAIGPVRIDIATPFNPRESDGDVQFYIGLGQAF